MSRPFLLLTFVISIIVVILTIAIVIAAWHAFQLFSIVMLCLIVAGAIGYIGLTLAGKIIDLRGKLIQQKLLHAGEHSYLVHVDGKPMMLTHYSPGRPTVVEADDGELGGAGEVQALAPHVPTFAELLQSGQIAVGRPLIFGCKINGQLRTGTWLELYSSAVAGLSGTGKTTTELFLLLQSVLQGARLLIVDPHAHKQDNLARRLAPLSHAFLARPAVEEREIAGYIQRLRKELDRRIRGAKGPLIIFCIDEFTKLMKTTLAKELGELIEDIAQEGRGVGIFAMLAGQVWKSTRCGGTELRYSLASCIVHRIQEEQAKLLIPQPYARKCPQLGKGQVWFYDTDGDIEQLSIPLTTADDVRAVATMLMGQPEVFTSNATADYAEAPTSRSIPLHHMEASQYQGGKRLEVDSEVRRVSPLSQRALDVEERILQQKSQNQILAEVWGVSTPGGREWQEAAAEYRAVLKELAEYRAMLTRLVEQQGV
jgi:hypothetical protein